MKITLVHYVAMTLLLTSCTHENCFDPMDGYKIGHLSYLVGSIDHSETGLSFQGSDLIPISKFGIMIVADTLASDEGEFPVTDLFRGEGCIKRSLFDTTTISKMRIFSTDTLSFNGMEYLPGRDLAVFFGADGEEPFNRFSSDRFFMELDSIPDYVFEGTLRFEVILKDSEGELMEGESNSFKTYLD